MNKSIFKMMKGTYIKWLAFLLMLCIVLTMMPFTVFSASQEEMPCINSGDDIKILAVPIKEVDLEKGSITISNGTTSGTLKIDYTNASGATQSEDNLASDTQFNVNQTNNATETKNNITVKSTVPANITFNGVNIRNLLVNTIESCGMLIDTGATLNLTLATGTENKFNGSLTSTIIVNDTAQLTIGGTGKMTANIADGWGAGIDSPGNGNITINSGEISASSHEGYNPAVIIGTGKIEINGGNVTTYGRISNNHGSIKLSNCNVNSTLLDTSSGTITVDNSTVTSPINSGTGTVTINSGKVTADGGIHGKNINLLGGIINAFSTSGDPWYCSDSAIGRLYSEADNSECNINIAQEAKITAFNKYIKSGGGTTKKAIDGTVTGTATVFQGIYTNKVAACTSTELAGDDGNSFYPPLIITPNFDYRSFAFTAPGNGNYAIFTNGVRQQGKQNGTYFATFTLKTGLNDFSDIYFAKTPSIRRGDILIEGYGDYDVKVTYTTEKGTIKTATGVPTSVPIEIVGTTSYNTITVNVPNKTITLLLNGVQISAPENKSALTVTDGNVILSGVGTTSNTLTGGTGAAGVSGNVTFGGSGAINIKGGTGAAGVSGNVTFGGSGAINIIGGTGAAGISGTVAVNTGLTGAFSVTGGDGQPVQPAVQGINNISAERFLIMGGADSANLSILTSGQAHTEHYIEVQWKTNVRTFDLQKGNITISDDTDTTIKVSYTDSFGQITMYGIDPSEMLTITQSRNYDTTRSRIAIDIKAEKKLNITFDGINIRTFQDDESPIYLYNNSEVYFVVKENTTNTVITHSYDPPFRISENAKATIGGSGTLVATGGGRTAAIIGGTVVFTDSVNVTATGGPMWISYAFEGIVGNVIVEKNATVVVIGGDGQGHQPDQISIKGTLTAKTSAITASESIDGSNPVPYNAQKLNTYRYLKIEPATFWVEISWESMEFTYVQSNWNASTLSYETDEWQCTADSNKITVTNNSNTSVNVSLSYDNSETRNDAVAGEFYTDSAFSPDKKVAAVQPLAKSTTANYYAKLIGRPAEVTNKTEFTRATIGKVTITIGGVG